MGCVVGIGRGGSWVEGVEWGDCWGVCGPCPAARYLSSQVERRIQVGYLVGGVISIEVMLEGPGAVRPQEGRWPELKGEEGGLSSLKVTWS